MIRNVVELGEDRDETSEQNWKRAAEKTEDVVSPKKVKAKLKKEPVLKVSQEMPKEEPPPRDAFKLEELEERH